MATSNLTTRSLPRDRYWAAEPDPEVLASYLYRKREDFWNHLEVSGIRDSAYKCWRFWHGLFYDLSGGNIVPAGIHGDIAQLGMNELRPRCNILLTYTTAQDFDWDAQGIDASQETLDANKKANQLLDWISDDAKYQAAEAFSRMAEHCFVYRVGYTAAIWDDKLGNEVGGDPDAELEYQYEGDLRILNPTLFDVVFDPHVQNFQHLQWVLFRVRENKFDLAERYFNQRDKILSLRLDTEQRERWFGIDRGLVLTEMDDDLVDKWYFIHLKTPSLSTGRLTCIAGDNVVLRDGVLPRIYKQMPIHQLVYSELQGSIVVGHSPILDAMPIQEAMNIEDSTILTNHLKFGQQKLVTQRGQPPDVQDLEPGATLLMGDADIKALDLLKSSPELNQYRASLGGVMDSVLNVAAVSRGILERETSGVASALLDMKTLQANSRFDKIYKRRIMDIGQTILEIWQVMAGKAGREMPTESEDRSLELVRFTSDNLLKVRRILVKQGSAALRTAAGRMNLAQMMVQLPDAPTNKRELVSIMEGAPLEKFLAPEDAQIQLVAEENARLKRLEEVVGDLADDHIFHMKSHASEILGNVESRFNPAIVAWAGAHMTWHMNVLMFDPAAQAYMVALGWATVEQIQAFLAFAPMYAAAMQAQAAVGQNGRNGGTQTPQADPASLMTAETPPSGREGAAEILNQARGHLEAQTQNLPAS